MPSKLKRGFYPVERYWGHIVPNIPTGRMVLDGDQVRVGSMRLQLFQTKGFKCSFCGIEGKYFRKEKDAHPFIRDVWHLNLYAVGDNNQHILMTKDHIVPVCKGGQTTLDNLQPMCAICNNEIKSDREGSYERLKFLRAFIKFDAKVRYR